MQTTPTGSQNFIQKWKRPFFRGVTRTGEMEFWALVLAFFWIYSYLQPVGLLGVIFMRGLSAVGGAWVVTLILKRIFRRQRPKTFDAILFPKLVAHASFPSAHSSTVFAMAAFLGMSPGFPMGIAVLILIWAVMVAASRVVLGVHYVSDVIVGAMVGVVSAYLLFSVLDPPSPGGGTVWDSRESEMKK